MVNAAKKLKKAAEKKSGIQTMHEVTGAARLPGSKYPVTEAEINHCHDREGFEELIEQALKRTNKGCCGGEGLLHRWKYTESYGKELEKTLRCPPPHTRTRAPYLPARARAP